MIHPAKKLLDFVDSITIYVDTDEGDEKPRFDYSRHVQWDGEPCAFCQSTEKPSLSGGRYYEVTVDEEAGIYICGRCLELLEGFAECSMI